MGELQKCRIMMPEQNAKHLMPSPLPTRYWDDIQEVMSIGEDLREQIGILVTANDQSRRLDEWRGVRLWARRFRDGRCRIGWCRVGGVLESSDG